MIGFILSLIGIAALTFTIGVVFGMYVSVEAIGNDNKKEMRRLCNMVKEYWNSKKSSTLG